MAASSQYATTVTTRALVNRVDGSYAIVSDELPGLFLAGADLDALMASVPEAIKTLYRLDCGMEVQVLPVGELPECTPEALWAPLSSTFVAVPVAA